MKKLLLGLAMAASYHTGFGGTLGQPCQVTVSFNLEFTTYNGTRQSDGLCSTNCKNLANGVACITESNQDGYIEQCTGVCQNGGCSNSQCLP